LINAVGTKGNNQLSNIKILKTLNVAKNNYSGQVDYVKSLLKHSTELSFLISFTGGKEFQHAIHQKHNI
jgi:hypothetical protein